VLVREPDQFGVEPAHPQLTFGVRLIELAEPHRHVAADDDRTLARLDDDHLRAGCVPRRRDEPDPGQQLQLAVDRLVPHAGRIDPFGDGVVVLAARVVELSTLDADRPAGEELVAAAVVEGRCDPLWERNLVPFFGRKRIGHIDSSLIPEWVRWCQKRKVSVWSIDESYTMLRSVLSFAKELGYINDFPFSRATRRLIPRGEPKDRHLLSRAES
jgi:hypothetical protein